MEEYASASACQQDSMDEYAATPADLLSVHNGS
jgi:hypothetical protein